MSSSLITEKRIDLVLVGFSQRRAELLSAAITQAEPDLFACRVIDEPLARLDINQLGGAITLAANETSARDEPVLQAAQRMRAEYFFWEPLHLFLKAPPKHINFEREWAIYVHALPPDVRALISSLRCAEPLSVSRREEVVISALSSLADDLSSFARTLDQTKVVRPERLRASIQNVLQELTFVTDDSFESLRLELEKLASLPIIEAASIVEITPLVLTAEVRVREAERADRLLSALHTLNNILRLSADSSEDVTEILHRIASCLRFLEERGLAALPDRIKEAATELCVNLTPLISSAVTRDAPADYLSYLAQLTSQLHSLVTVAIKSDRISEAGTGIERIIVIEDDPEWRQMIVKVLKTMLGQEAMEIQEAGTVADAQSLLDAPGPALVLVDLGLPTDADSELVPDAGLSLIKQFRGSDAQQGRVPHRFIILTATENFTKAVHDALSFGISPANYLQKNPRTWESALRAQVRLILQPSPARPPRIEVFRRTGRIARIEGFEVKLNYPQWCLLAILAQGRRGRWHEPKKLANILYWNYSLNPESRSSETDALDPEERILLQLPHYSSDLRGRLADAYAKAVHKPLPVDVLSFEEESGYRLNADAQILDRVNEHFRIGHRPSVLVVEDNDEWGREIVQELERRGFGPRLARWIEEARDLIESDPPDLISLDIELPATREELLEGKADAGRALELLRFLKQYEPRFPIAILTAVPWRDDVMLEILRQEVRIDDYLSKHSDQPILRLAGALARLWQESLTNSRILDWDPLTPLYPIEIDRVGGLLSSVSGYPIKPTGKGRDILKVLSETPNIFVSRLELLDAIYGDLDGLDDGPDDPDKALNQHIKRLRKTITDATSATVQGDHVICGDRGIYWLRGIVQ